jgi:hypothetical protein
MLRAMRRQVKGRGAAIVGLVVLAVLIFSATGCVPGLRAAFGLPASYTFSTLRSGTIYTEARPGSLIWGSPNYQESLVFASTGDRIVAVSNAEVQQGRIMLSIVPGLWGADELVSEQVTQTTQTTLEATVPDTGFYRVTASYVFAFRGANTVDWHLD